MMMMMMMMIKEHGKNCYILAQPYSPSHKKEEPAGT